MDLLFLGGIFMVSFMLRSRFINSGINYFDLV